MFICSIPDKEFIVCLTYGARSVVVYRLSFGWPSSTLGLEISKPDLLENLVLIQPTYPPHHLKQIIRS